MSIWYLVVRRTPSAMKRAEVVKHAIDHGIQFNVRVRILDSALVLRFSLSFTYN